MAARLRKAVPHLIRLSPTLAMELDQIQQTILNANETRLELARVFHEKGLFAQPHLVFGN